MDQHPVPQNVTTFQFRLIGDMTIKQFGFLAAGAILAFISYKLPLPFFFSWPLTMVFALAGVGFAFVPIEDRPMDVWVLSFLKNVYNPTIFEWEQAAPQKTPPSRQPVQRQQAASQSSASAPVALQQTTIHQTPNAPTRTTAGIIGTMYTQKPSVQAPPFPSRNNTTTIRQSGGFFDWIFDLFKPKAVNLSAATTVPMQAAHMQTPSVVGTHLDISMPPTVSKQQPSSKPLVEQQKPISVIPTQTQEQHQEHSSAEDKISSLQKQLEEAIAQKERISQEMKKTQAPPPMSSPAPVPVQQARHPSPTSQQATPQNQHGGTYKQPTVKIITPEGAVKAGLPRLTTFPNVVTGITKDSDNNFLPGVLVTVKDKDGVPVRALKTNRLGQFAASTPLSNGVYFVEIEDPRQRYTFDRVQITLNGSIVPALEIITKSQKQISRDKIAKELFGTTN